jgi:hypothetical protein
MLPMASYHKNDEQELKTDSFFFYKILKQVDDTKIFKKHD